MPIPALTSNGLLPAGIFDATLAEIKTRFGAFQGSDQRPKLFLRFEELIGAMKSIGLYEALLIDGSFVTAKPIPNDIDILGVLRVGHDFERDLPISEYALVSRTLLRRRFGLDVIVAEKESSLYNTYVDFFSRVREAPQARKGLVRLLL